MRSPGHSALVHGSDSIGLGVPASVHLATLTATPLPRSTQSKVRVRSHVGEHPDHGFGWYRYLSGHSDPLHGSLSGGFTRPASSHRAGAAATCRHRQSIERLRTPLPHVCEHGDHGFVWYLQVGVVGGAVAG